MKLTFIAHSAFVLEDGTNQVMIDPFISGNPLATFKPEDFAPNTIILTHAHADHLGDTVSIARRCGSTVIANAELAGWIGSQGVEKAIGANHGGTVTFEGGSAKFVPAWHTSSYQTAEGPIASGVPAGHVVRFGGKTIYFAGDTCLFSDMQLIGEEDLDIAVVPIGDHFTMGIKDAAARDRISEAQGGDPLPLQHVPADQTGSRGVQVGGRVDHRRSLPDPRAGLIHRGLVQCRRSRRKCTAPHSRRRPC